MGLRIGFDVDEVIADFIGEFRQEAREVTGKACDGVPGDWEFRNWELTPEDIKAIWRRIEDRMDFWLSVKPLPDVPPPSVWKALAQKHTLFFITSRRKTRGRSVEWQTSYWIKENLGIEFPCVIVSEKKGLLVDALRLDAFIDDKKEHLYEIRFSLALANTKLYLRDQSHNRVVDHSLLPVRSFTRIHDLGAFINEIGTIESESPQHESPQHKSAQYEAYPSYLIREERRSRQDTDGAFALSGPPGDSESSIVWEEEVYGMELDGGDAMEPPDWGC